MDHVILVIGLMLILMLSLIHIYGFGQIYKNMSLASGIVPQITAVYGECGGGLAVLAELSDFVFVEEKKAKLFVNSPNALDGNYESKLDTSSAEFMAKAGVADFIGEMCIRDRCNTSC